MSSIFDFDVPDNEGNNVRIEKGSSAYLVVNVASEWGLTKSNYRELQDLYSRYSEKGLEILAFPCNDFGAQEPGSNAQVLDFARSKGATFPIMGKVTMAHPLYTFLTNYSDNGITKGPMTWNFGKFLCDSEGIPVNRFGPRESPLSFEAHISRVGRFS